MKNIKHNSEVRKYLDIIEGLVSDLSKNKLSSLLAVRKMGDLQINDCELCYNKVYNKDIGELQKTLHTIHVFATYKDKKIEFDIYPWRVTLMELNLNEDNITMTDEHFDDTLLLEIQSNYNHFCRFVLDCIELHNEITQK